MNIAYISANSDLYNYQLLIRYVYIRKYCLLLASPNNDIIFQSPNLDKL